MDKAAYLTSLRTAWSDCRGCPLSNGRTTVVFGEGNPHAQLLVVGGAPGAHEDARGVPFAGQAGQLLDQYLAAVSDHPELRSMMKTGQIDHLRMRQLLLEHVFYANVVACRPEGNRDPEPAEIAACRPRLLELIYLVDPVLIVSIGKFSLQSLLGVKKVSLTSRRGEVYDVTIPGRYGPITYPVLATMSTAHLLRINDFKQEGGMSDRTFNDHLLAWRILDEFNWLHHGLPKPTRPKPAKGI